jgi:hypothetical protein
MANEGDKKTPASGKSPDIAAALKAKPTPVIPQKWLDEMLKNTKDIPTQLKALVQIVGDSQLASNQASLTTINQLNKALGPSLQNTFVDALRKYDKDEKNSESAKEEDKKYKDRKKIKDKEQDEKQKKITDDLSNKLGDKVKSTTTKTSGPEDLSGAEAAEASLASVQVQPVTIESISAPALESLKSILSPLASKGVDKEAKKNQALEPKAGEGIIAALGKSLGAGIKALAVGVGGGIAALGEGIGAFLTGLSVGLTALAPALIILADPLVLAGMAILVGAIIGLGYALRVAAPAIAATMPFFEKLAEVLGKVLMHALDKIPDMIKAVGVAIGTVLTMAGPVIIELAKIIGGTLINAIKVIGTEIAAVSAIVLPYITTIVKIVKEAIIQLAPFAVQLVKIIKDAIVQIMPFIVQLATIIKDTLVTVMPYIVDLGKAIKDVLVTAFEMLKPIVLALIPVIEEVATYLGTTLVMAVKYVGPVLINLSEAIKDVISGISTFLSGIVTYATNLVNKISEVIETGIDGISHIVDSIGNTIQGTIQAIGDSIIGVITTVTNSIEQLSNISGDKLKDTASGITAVALAMVGFGASAVTGGVGNLVGGLLSKVGDQNPPLEQLLAIGEQASNFDKIAIGLGALKVTLNEFGSIKVDLDPVKKFIGVIGELKNVLSPAAGGIISGLVSSKPEENPIQQLIAAGKQSEHISLLALGVDTLKNSLKSISELKVNLDPVTSFINTVNGTNLAKMVALSTALSVLPLAAVGTTNTGTSTNSAAVGTTNTGTSTNSAATSSSKQTQFFIANEPVVPGTPLSDKQITTMDQAISFGNVYPSNVMVQYNKQKTEKNQPAASVATTESAKLNKITNRPESEGVKITPSLRLQELQLKSSEKVIQKLEELIKTVGPILAANKSTPASSNTTTSIINNSNTNNVQNGGDGNTNRDIPYIERNKYRQDMIYSRGLL